MEQLKRQNLYKYICSFSYIYDGEIYLSWSSSWINLRTFILNSQYNLFKVFLKTHGIMHNTMFKLNKLESTLKTHCISLCVDTLMYMHTPYTFI